MTLQVKVPAKINLWLEVIRKRPDGYHELSSLMLPIDLCDDLELEMTAEKGIRLSCDQMGVPGDSQNLAWKAAESYLKASGLGTEAGVHIRLTKNIPVGAGLGGGSSDAAAVLMGMNRLLDEHLTMEQLHEVAQKLGADVPFFLYGHPALATGIGEKLERVEGVPDYPLVLIKPPLSVSTRWVYQSLKLTRGQGRIKLSSFLAHPWKVQEILENDLESVTQKAYPVLLQMKTWLLSQGALGALMSGSGPTVFGVFRKREDAESVAHSATRAWPDCWVESTAVCSSGATHREN